jgi:hypothetical protein
LDSQRGDHIQPEQRHIQPERHPSVLLDNQQAPSCPELSYLERTWPDEHYLHPPSWQLEE